MKVRCSHGNALDECTAETCYIAAGVRKPAPPPAPPLQLSAHGQCNVCRRGMERQPGDRRRTCGECRARYVPVPESAEGARGE